MFLCIFIKNILFFRLLKTLYLYDLPEVKKREQCISELKLKLPYCKIDFPLVEER